MVKLLLLSYIFIKCKTVVNMFFVLRLNNYLSVKYVLKYDFLSIIKLL